MKLALKTRDNWAEDYLYEVHRFGCSHLRRESSQVFVSEKYESPEKFIEADMGNPNDKDNYIPRENYKIMACIKVAPKGIIKTNNKKMIKDLVKELNEAVDKVDSLSLNLEVSLRMKERPTESEVSEIRDAGALLGIVQDRLRRTEAEMWKVALKEEVKD